MKWLLLLLLISGILITGCTEAIIITGNNGTFNTSIYILPTDTNACIHLQNNETQICKEQKT